VSTGKLNPPNQALFELIKANRGKTVTSEQILDVTKWQASTWKTHWSKGVYTPFLSEKSKTEYVVTAAPDLDEAAFYRRISQNHQARELGANCKNPLARALLHKAKDNMTLALELYNRPSLDNRLDGFCVLFCMAWEQLLKAEIIEASGEEKIYRAPAEKGKRRETISLEAALNQRFQENDPVRKNVGLIAEFRHEATHLLMRELQGVMSRVFQSGVMNFARRFLATSEHPLFPTSSAGLLSLVSDFDTEPDVITLRQMYGQTTGDEIAGLLKTISAEIKKQDNVAFAVPIGYSLVLTKKESEGDIKLVPGNAAPHEGTIIEKAVPLEHKYPYKATDAAAEVAKQTGETFTMHSFIAVCHVEKWRKSNNEYHHEMTHPIKYRVYSKKAVEFCVAKLKSDPDYLEKALTSYSASMKKKGKKKAVA